MALVRWFIMRKVDRQVRYNLVKMNARLLTTKFHIPPWRASEVPRLRLIEQLNAGLSEGRKLTLISAPAGYGKTTLVADWIHSLNSGDQAISWLSLDPADNEPVRFFTYFLAAFQRLDDAIREKLQHLLTLPKLPNIHGLMDELINELTAYERPILLVMEDYHVISNPVIHEAAEYFLDNQPAGVHLVLITRQDPPFPLPRMRARRQMIEIRARDLRFTPKEACLFFSHAMQLALNEEDARLLEERTEGWAVGLQLAGLALQNNTDPERFIQTFRGSHRYVLDYLAEEVISQQGEAIRLFLSQTSVLDQFNADLCCALTGQPDGQAVIDRLEKANLFIVPLDNERIWYRYHHLFRDYLATLLNKPEQAALNKKASAWQEMNDLLPEAVGYALASGDSDFSAGVIERVVNQSTTWSGGNVGLLTSWLDALPKQAIRARPQLNLNASRIFYLASQFDLAEKHLAQAEDSLKLLPQTPETEQLLALAVLYRGSIAGVRGDVQQALEQTTYAQARLPKDNYLAHARAYFNLGQVYEMADQLDRAGENYIRSSDAAQVAGVLFLAIQARCASAQVQVKQGNLHQAEQSCQAAIRFADGARIPPLGLAYIGLGCIALERNELESADALLLDGVALSRQGGLMDNVIMGLSTLARLRACQGDEAGALSIVQEARKLIQAFGLPLMASYADAFLARLRLCSENKQEAIQWAAGYQTSQKISNSEYEDLTLARVLLATCQLNAVPLLLHPILEKAMKAGRHYTCIEATLLLSVFHLIKNEPISAESWLTQSLKIAAGRGYIRIFLDEGGPLLNLLHKSRSAAPELVDILVKTIQSERKTGFTANAHLPEPLSEQELRVLELISAGKSNQEIAAVLVISVGTAKWHVHNILQKLSVNNRPQAIVRARELGLS
jgi:LuxR family transcriptional regulator, maltose regulon positive regulatory protein